MHSPGIRAGGEGKIIGKVCYVPWVQLFGDFPRFVNFFNYSVSYLQ